LDQAFGLLVLIFANCLAFLRYRGGVFAVDLRAR
jgi:hypothetical protein